MNLSFVDVFVPIYGNIGDIKTRVQAAWNSVSVTCISSPGDCRWKNHPSQIQPVECGKPKMYTISYNNTGRDGYSKFIESISDKWLKMVYYVIFHIGPNHFSRYRNPKTLSTLPRGQGKWTPHFGMIQSFNLSKYGVLYHGFYIYFNISTTNTSSWVHWYQPFWAQPTPHLLHLPGQLQNVGAVQAELREPWTSKTCGWLGASELWF